MAEKRRYRLSLTGVLPFRETVVVEAEPERMAAIVQTCLDHAGSPMALGVAVPELVDVQEADDLFAEWTLESLVEVRDA